MCVGGGGSRPAPQGPWPRQLQLAAMLNQLQLRAARRRAAASKHQCAPFRDETKHVAVAQVAPGIFDGAVHPHRERVRPLPWLLLGGRGGAGRANSRRAARAACFLSGCSVRACPRSGFLGKPKRRVALFVGGPSGVSRTRCVALLSGRAAALHAHKGRAGDERVRPLEQHGRLAQRVPGGACGIPRTSLSFASRSVLGLVAHS